MKRGLRPALTVKLRGKIISPPPQVLLAKMRPLGHPTGSRTCRILANWLNPAEGENSLSQLSKIVVPGRGQGWKHLQREGASEVCSHQGSQGNQLSVHSRTRLLSFACLGDGLQKSHHAAV